MYIYVIFDPNQAEKPQGNKVVQYFEILNSVIWDRKDFENFSLLRELQISPRPIAPSNFSPL